MSGTRGEERKREGEVRKRGCRTRDAQKWHTVIGRKRPGSCEAAARRPHPKRGTRELMPHSSRRSRPSHAHDGDSRAVSSALLLSSFLPLQLRVCASLLSSSLRSKNPIAIHPHFTHATRAHTPTAREYTLSRIARCRCTQSLATDRSNACAAERARPTRASGSRNNRPPIASSARRSHSPLGTRPHPAIC